jgi:hypothetical protein
MMIMEDQRKLTMSHSRGLNSTKTALAYVEQQKDAIAADV